MTQVQAALVASAASTFCALGDVVLQLRGMSIGGSLSSSAVAVHLAFEESTAFDSERLAAIASRIVVLQMCSGAGMLMISCLLVALYVHVVCRCSLAHYTPKNFLKSSPRTLLLEIHAIGYFSSSTSVGLILPGL